MGIGEKLVSASGATEDPTDSDFYTNVFLTHFDGANNGWNELATNDASGGDTLQPATKNAGRSYAQGTFSPFRGAGRYSAVFDQTDTQYIYTNGSAYQTNGQSAFYYSVWIWIDKTDSYWGTIFDNRPSGTTGNYNTLYYDTSLNLHYHVNNASRITGTSALSLNTWHHIVLTRETTNYKTKLFVDGSQVGSDYTDTTNYGNNLGQRLMIGRSGYTQGNGYSHHGYITDLVLRQGYSLTASEVAAKYAARQPTLVVSFPYDAFVWPNYCGWHNRADRSIRNQVCNVSGSVRISGFSPFNRLEDPYEDANGGSAHFAGGSGSNNNNLGSGNPAIALNQNTFTCEAWIYMTAVPADGVYDVPAAWDLNGTGGAYSRMQWGVLQDMRLTLRWYDGIVKNCQGSTTYMSLYQWYHIAVSVSNGGINLYVNGLQQSRSGTTTLTTRQGSTNSLTSWGAGIHTYSDFTGYIAGVRIQDGTAQYSATFNPSTSPPTDNTNCNVLVNYTGSDAKDVSQHNNVLFYGNAETSTAQSKFGTASFHPNGGYATFPPYPARNDFAFLSGNWTIECFVRMDSLSAGFQCIFHASWGLQFYVNNNVLSLYCNNTDNGSGYIIGANSSATLASADTWYHVAAYRVGSAFYCSVDGVVNSMGTSSAELARPSALAPQIGTWNSGTYTLGGYIDEFRISRKARYGSSNFSAPSSAFPDIGE